MNTNTEKIRIITKISAASLTAALAAAMLLFTGCGDEAITDCTSDFASLNFNGEINNLCEITADANHIVISDLSLGTGSFTIYAGTDSSGANGAVILFEPNGANTDVTVTYKASGSNDIAVDTSIIDSGSKYWLIGFQKESTSAHVAVKETPGKPDDWEAVEPTLNIFPNKWTTSTEPHGSTIRYKGTGNAALESVRLFHEDNHEH